MKKVSINKLIVEKELVSSRQKAMALIMAGCVFVGNRRILKSGELFNPDVEITIKGKDHPYVSRGGVKLAHALDEFKLDVNGMICMDVGASTGGFTDCLLRRGALRVYAVDVGYGQLAWKLVEDKRVVVIERTNVRTMEKGRIPKLVDLAVIDVSFISLSAVFSAVNDFLENGALIVALIKPQFEIEKGLVGKGGIVRNKNYHEAAIEKVRTAAVQMGWSCNGIVESPILGAKGNREFLIYLQK